jgi:hypothetical protein
MRVLTIATALALLAAVTGVNYTYAEDAACATKAGEKKLAGAAKTSFMKKCVEDSCDATAKEKKYAGAAKTSFTKKCIEDGLATAEAPKK